MRKLIASARIFLSGAWLAYIALFRWTQPASYVASKIVMPLSQILFFTFLGVSATGRHTSEFYVVGNALQIAAINGIYGVTMTVGRERNEGTLIYLIGSPSNRKITSSSSGPTALANGQLQTTPTGTRFPDGPLTGEVCFSSRQERLRTRTTLGS